MALALWSFNVTKTCTLMRNHNFLLFFHSYKAVLNVPERHFRSFKPFFTVPLPAVTSMTVYDEAQTSMRVRWELVDGASGYLLNYNTINASVPSGKMEVSACLTDAFQNTLQTISQNFHLCFIRPQVRVNPPLASGPFSIAKWSKQGATVLHCYSGL